MRRDRSAGSLNRVRRCLLFIFGLGGAGMLSPTVMADSDAVLNSSRVAATASTLMLMNRSGSKLKATRCRHRVDSDAHEPIWKQAKGVAHIRRSQQRQYQIGTGGQAPLAERLSEVSVVLL